MVGFWPGSAKVTRYAGLVDRIPRADRPYAVAAAVSYDFNNELTIILSSVNLSIEMLDFDHPALPLLLDLQDAAERCAGRAEGLLNYSASKGTLPGAVSFESLIE